MCGITGFADFNKATSKEILLNMCRSLAHRGPDGDGYAIFEKPNVTIGLGHRRLSILDLTTAGTQPFNYLHYHLTFNGEVYNFAEIKMVLQKSGHTFNSHSDTEVIVHAYAEWGSNCVDHFIGMFAFVIYDEKKNELFCCRDRAGVKPFFYYYNNGLFIFASELKAILSHPSFVKEINTDAVSAYMQYGYVPAPQSIFKNTFKLEPGYFINYSLANNKMTAKRYWNVYDAYNNAPIDIGEEEAIKETEKLLINAFEYRMVSDVPVGVFLSGGYDSACVTALLQTNSTEKLKTFTIGMSDAGLNEAPFAKAIANRLGTDHTEYYLTKNDALNIIPTLPLYYDEPFADSSAIPTMLVSKIARSRVTVALSADGGDEIFGGYTRYQVATANFIKLNKIPQPLRKVAAGAMGLLNPAVVPGIKGKASLEDKYQKIKELLRDPSSENVMLSLTKLFNDRQTSNLLKADLSVNSSILPASELKEEHFTMLRYMMATDFQTYLVDDILQKIDRAGMSVSLEGREPFLDHRIIEWAARLPDSLKIKDGNKKYILKEIVHKYIPKQEMERPKMGFGIPLKSWLQEDLQPLVAEYLSEKYIKEQDIFNFNAISGLVNSFYSKQANSDLAEKIWRVLMFQMWYEKWMAPASVIV